MADLLKAHAVSGETMAEVRLSPGRRAASDDFVDAEYIEVAAEARFEASVAQPAASRSAGLTMLDSANHDRQTVSRGGALFWMFGLTAVVAAFWVSGGHAYVRESTFFAMQEIKPKLSIAEVRSRVEVVDGVTALLVDGDIVNDGEASGAVPSLSIDVISQIGDARTYTLGADGNPLAPGAKFSFSSRLDMPKEGVKTVLVTFDE